MNKEIFKATYLATYLESMLKDIPSNKLYNSIDKNDVAGKNAYISDLIKTAHDNAENYVNKMAFSS